MNNASNISQQDNIYTFEPPVPAPLLQQNTAINTNKVLTVQGNYVYPMKENGRIEAGYKATIRNKAMD